MNSAGSRHVAIWIDQHQAIVLVLEAELPDGSGPHPSGNGWCQVQVDAQGYLGLQQAHDAVLSHLEPGDEILILGPAQAKRDLHQRIEQLGGLKGKVVGLQDAANLAEVELVFPTDVILGSEEMRPATEQPLILPPAKRLSERLGMSR